MERVDLSKRLPRRDILRGTAGIATSLISSRLDLFHPAAACADTLPAMDHSTVTAQIRRDLRLGNRLYNLPSDTWKDQDLKNRGIKLIGTEYGKLHLREGFARSSQFHYLNLDQQPSGLTIVCLDNPTLDPKALTDEQREQSPEAAEILQIWEQGKIDQLKSQAQRELPQLLQQINQLSAAPRTLDPEYWKNYYELNDLAFKYKSYLDDPVSLINAADTSEGGVFVSGWQYPDTVLVVKTGGGTQEKQTPHTYIFLCTPREALLSLNQSFTSPEDYPITPNSALVRDYSYAVTNRTVVLNLWHELSHSIYYDNEYQTDLEAVYHFNLATSQLYKGVSEIAQQNRGISEAEIVDQVMKKNLDAGFSIVLQTPVGYIYG